MKTLKLRDGRELNYELTRKPVKNINFRVKSDGTVYVSASPRVSAVRIERILAERADYFFGAAEHLKTRESRSELSLERVNWLGTEYPVRVIGSARECAVQDEAELRVYTRHGDDEEYLRGLVRAHLWKRFEALCGELDAQVRGELFAAGLQPPETRLTVKDMKTRWGSCSYNRGHISINFRLCAYPRETVLSVMWHEYAHYWHHGHSAEFYAFIIRFYPEYYRWNGLLK